ncbi:MAG: metalloregulator ArsR/SmtB family transcription factor [Clostridiales bacterium]|nr:metalloregulator ArsR/SmtB family transcription factor [Clostridiales bacterium]MDY4036208.1 metalloregulator ArsR/SmtB family transcription factor [Candidatus Pseudoscilispira sp.]
MEEQAQKIAELLKLLANEHRLLIVCALIQGKLTVGEIHKHAPDITASALSQHLNQLRTARILASEKQGMNVIYWIQDERVIALMESIKEQYCKSESGAAT